MFNWGPSFWRCIHYTAIHQKNDFIDRLPPHIPCETCKLEWVLSEVDEDLVDWSIRFHNTVNAKLGKWDKWDRTDFNIAQKPTCDICEGHEHIHSFPWMFLYTLAKAQNTDIEFIQEFVSTYPCQTCRNKLIIDLPQHDETHVEWVYRNHTRFNQMRGLPQPHPLRSETEVVGEGIGSSTCADC